jgi:hypothetical protein
MKAPRQAAASGHQLVRVKVVVMDATVATGCHYFLAIVAVLALFPIE